MIPAAFEYERAESVEHAIELLGQHGEEAKLLAGGHSLIPLLKLRLASPTVLIDVGRLSELDYVHDGGDHIAIGALTRHKTLASDPIVTAECGLIGLAASKVGDVQVRERGTIGGSLAHADPAADLPAVMVALDATMVAMGPNGERTISATDFFEYFLTSSLHEGEVLTEVRVPKLGSGWGWHYEKFTKRSTDWAIVGVAAAVRRENGNIAEARIGLCNVGNTPMRASAAESALAGKAVGGSELADAAAQATEGLEPSNDLNATAEYRLHLVRILTHRAVEKAAAG